MLYELGTYCLVLSWFGNSYLNNVKSNISGNVVTNEVIEYA